MADWSLTKFGVDLTKAIQPAVQTIGGAQVLTRGFQPSPFGVTTGSVIDFGAVGDGVTDDLAAFQAALASSTLSIYVPAGNYRLSGGITIPGGKNLISLGFIPGNPPGAAKLTFDLSVATCVTLDGTGLTTAGFVGISVTRASGSIPAGSIGVLVSKGYQQNLDNICCERHAIGFKWLASGSDGITSHCSRLYTGAITEHHVIIDSWPELFVTQSRFGMNGSGDQSCTAYVRITGGTGIGGIGPNTILFNQCQFNQGSNTPSYWLEFTNIVGEFTTAVEFKFEQCHTEGVGTAAVKSTSDVSGIDRFTLVNNTFNLGSIPFWALDVATRPFQWFFTDNLFFCSTFNLAPTQSFQRITITGGRISGTSSFTGASGSILVIQGVYFSDVLTLAGAWSMLYATGVIENGVTDTSTGRKFLHLADLLKVQNNTSSTPMDVINANDGASVSVGRHIGARATPANNDTITHDWMLNNASAASKTALRENIRMSNVTAGAEAAIAFWSIMTGGALTDKLQFTPTTWAPVTNDGLALGASTVSWSDLFLASGAVINWANGEVTLTETDANTLTLGGAALALASLTLPGTPIVGALEYDGTAHYSTHAANERGVLQSMQWIRLSATYTLASQTAAQKLFNSSANGAITVAGSTTYEFKCYFDLSSMSSSSGTFGFAIAGTATLTSIRWKSLAVKAGTAVGSALDTSAATNTATLMSDAASSTAISPSNTATAARAWIEGIICVNGGGTIIPQVSLGVAAAAVVGINSFFEIWPIGTNTQTTQGNWS